MSNVVNPSAVSGRGTVSSSPASNQVQNQMQKIRNESQRDMLTQMQMQEESRKTSFLTNMMNAYHEMAMAVIRNIKA